jgi:hypothetical protein
MGYTHEEQAWRGLLNVHLALLCAVPNCALLCAQTAASAQLELDKRVVVGCGRRVWSSGVVVGRGRRAWSTHCTAAKYSVSDTVLGSTTIIIVEVALL